MEILYRLKQHIKKRHCSLLESFQAYKSYDRFKNTELHPEEFLKVLLSIKFDISEISLYKCLDCLESLDYVEFVNLVEQAVNPRAKGMRNLRKFKTEDAIYEYIAKQCCTYFPLGSLLKDHDYDNNGKVELRHFERILRKGASEMTEGDLAFFLDRVDDGTGQVDSREILSNVNYFIRDEEKRQKLESKIDEKLFNPLGESDK
jgi:Ca2+-binding EF-hand superfamily protein